MEGKVEYWDIYDENKKKTGKTARRGIDALEEGEYHIVVNAVIINSKNEILMSKRAPFKKFPLYWELSGGSIIEGETSLEGMLREIKEELGIEFTKKEAIYLKEIKREAAPRNFKDIWVFKKDVKDEEVTLPDGEAIEWKWVTKDEFIKMKENGELIPTLDFNEELFEIASNIKQRESYSFIGKTLDIKIDRPLGSIHPKHRKITYLVNYGYLPNVMSADGEELDCYLLGVDEPVTEYKGDCIAVIHRTNDDDDKLIIVPKVMNYSDEEIRNYTDFVEKYFESEIIR